MKLLLLPALAAGLTLAACAPQQQTVEPQAAASAPSAARGGVVKIASGDAASLSGSWDGSYVMDSGFRGGTKMNLTPTSATTVAGYFEYFWGSGNYSRFPEGTGTVTGEIKPDGKLYFGDWDLALTRDGDKLTFKTRQAAFGGTATFRWRKTVAALRSESE